MAAWREFQHIFYPCSCRGTISIITELDATLIALDISRSFKGVNNSDHRIISLFLRTGLLSGLLGRHFYLKRKKKRKIGNTVNFMSNVTDLLQCNFTLVQQCMRQVDYELMEFLAVLQWFVVVVA